MPTAGFRGLAVLSFESRRAKEVATLVTTFGGRATVAPALREVPLESNTEALGFAAALARGEYDIVMFLTGVGVRALLQAIAPVYSPQEFAAALARTRVVSRGPKPLVVLRELQVDAWVTAPEPNTWREVLVALDARADEYPLPGTRIAVQEYGVPNPELLAGLRTRGAHVTSVPVYRWALPEDTGPLRDAVTAISEGAVDVVLFTTGVQLLHLWQIAGQMGLEPEVRHGLTRAVIASIGPTTSEELRRHRLEPDFEASHPKMGILVREAAERSGDLLRLKGAAK
jgi:uroporphyrinogen-III synthase